MKKKIFGRKMSAEKIVMALSLDQNKKTERVIIGEQTKVTSWLAHVGAADFYYDAERPLGTFLLEHEAQQTEEWNLEAGSLLMLAVSGLIGRKENEDAAWAYLEDKLKTQNAVCQFTAYQCWHWYGECCGFMGSEEKGREYGNQVLTLTRSFNQKLWTNDYAIESAWGRIQHVMEKSGGITDKYLDIRYPTQAGDEEWLMITESFYPALQYYLKQLMKWDLCFCKCSNCGNVFIATSRHHSLCSKACHVEKNRQNKREFDARAKKNGYDIDYKNTCQRMRNRLHKFEKQEGISEEQRRKAETCFETFRKEAIQRKKRIKDIEDYRAFRNWLFDEERKFEKTCTDGYASALINKK